MLQLLLKGTMMIKISLRKESKRQRRPLKKPKTRKRILQPKTLLKNLK